jgi:hypothetical protein
MGLLFVVGEAGIEPALPYGKQILSLLWDPVNKGDREGLDASLTFSVVFFKPSLLGGC